MTGCCQVEFHHVPATLHISLETNHYHRSGHWAQLPQLIEIFINISLLDVFQQQKQDSQRVFQDQNESVRKRAECFKSS